MKVEKTQGTLVDPSGLVRLVSEDRLVGHQPSLTDPSGLLEVVPKAQWQQRVEEMVEVAERVVGQETEIDFTGAVTRIIVLTRKILDEDWSPLTVEEGERLMIEVAETIGYLHWLGEEADRRFVEHHPKAEKQSRLFPKI